MQRETLKSAKHDEAYGKVIAALERDKLVSKSLLKTVPKARLEMLCNAKVLQVAGNLKDNYIDALREWVSLATSENMSFSSN